MGVEDARRWKVGELARATGLTVRALHHYDRLGLLVPSERTFAGHRLYSAGDVERLYRVLALRQVGLALSEIGRLLDADAPDLVTTVRRQLARVERDLARGERLRVRLGDLLGTLESSLEPSIEQFIDALEAMVVVETDVDVVMRVPYDADPRGGPPRLKTHFPGRKVVLLKERGGDRVLPIWISAEPGYALVLALCGQQAQRPLSNDLAARLLELGGQRIERVVIEWGDDDYGYVATLTLSMARETHELDARPGDALNIAARTGAPIMVDADLIDRKGASSPEEVEPRLTRDLASMPSNDETKRPGEWRSLTKDLLASSASS